MITIHEWKTMSGKEQTLWLEANIPANNGPIAMRGRVHGFGVNDAEYCTNHRIERNRVVCPAYDAWAGMLRRCYNHKIHLKRPTYIGVTVFEGWHLFSEFRRWWIDNQVDNFHLDKDLLSYSREYSPETCIFVPAWLNTFTIDRGAARGDWPIGVSFNKRLGRLQSRCCNKVTGKREHLGYFDDPREAGEAWLTRKLEIAFELKPRMDEIDLRIYPRVVEIINNAK